MNWKDISGYEGLYQISDTGEVRKADGHLMKTGDNGNGYKYITLYKNNKRKNHYIHRLVADAFIPKVDGKEIVNHIDYDKSNNNVSNLEWCTQKENLNHSKPHMRGRKMKGNSSTGESYIYFRKGRYRITIDKKEYPSRPTLEEAIKYRNEILLAKGVVV